MRLWLIVLLLKKVLVYKRTNNPEIHLTEGRDYYWDVETAKFPGYLPPVSVNSEDPLFLLYTSGSTGTPKGLFILLLVTYWVLLFPLNTFLIFIQKISCLLLVMLVGLLVTLMPCMVHCY